MNWSTRTEEIMAEVPERGLEIRLAQRPTGWPTAANFATVEAPVAKPADGQILVRNIVMSVDPYMRGRMDDVKSYAPPFQVGAPLDGGAVGEVVRSTVDGVKPGDTVLHQLGWREYAVLDATAAIPVDPAVAPPSAYLGVLGMPGLTAYAGLLEVAQFQPGDTVFVSGAAGAVGSVVGQIAKLKGAKRVIGSAGSAAKVAYLRDELGFDAAFNYKDGPVLDQLRAAAPVGIDVYIDNVGADHLAAAIECLNRNGRVAMCGAVAVYNEPRPGVDNLFLAIGKRLTLRGFIVGDHSARMPDMVAEVGAWLREGRIVYEETVVDGLENAPEAFIGMLRGANTGKMIVRL
jgi:NADPH-dependent curcumin reductase CurA